jgi:hypothetical protein
LVLVTKRGISADLESIVIGSLFILRKNNQLPLQDFLKLKTVVMKATRKISICKNSHDLAQRTSSHQIYSASAAINCYVLADRT